MKLRELLEYVVIGTKLYIKVFGEKDHIFIFLGQGSVSFLSPSILDSEIFSIELDTMPCVTGQILFVQIARDDIKERTK